MQMTELSVVSKEQMVHMQNGYVAVLRFDMIYKRWFYDLYRDDGTLLYAGIALPPDSAPLNGIAEESLGLVDLSEDGEEYEPYSELGGRLALMEITE